MERAVTRGVARRSLEGLRLLCTQSDAGLDEKSFGKGHDTVSVRHDLEGRRVLEVVPERTREAAHTLWTAILKPQRQAIDAVAMDMWVPYLEATRVAAPQALIVHDKFPCAKELNKAVDLVRRREHRELKARGTETLTKTRYLWLKNPLHWTDRQRERFQTLKVDALKVGRAWAIKEAFADFWDYRYTASAHQFFDRGFLGDPLPTPAHHCVREDPQTPSAGVARHHETSHTRAAAEGMNAQIQLLKANARGYRNFTQYRIAILFHCGKLDLYPAGCPS